MTSHPNRGWRSRWVVQGREARHGPSGLVVRFRQADALRLSCTRCDWCDEMYMAADVLEECPRCRSHVDQRQGWDGAAPNGQGVFQALREAHGQEEAARMLTRLLREAGDIFSEQQS